MNESLRITNLKDTSGKPYEIGIADGVFVDPETINSPTTDGGGYTVIPGLVDLHTHLREPGFEDAETILSGSLAAAAGGFTV